MVFYKKELSNNQQLKKVKYAKHLSDILQEQGWIMCWRSDWSYLSNTINNKKIVINLPWCSSGKYYIYILDNTKNIDYKKNIFGKGPISSYRSWEDIPIKYECIFKTNRRSAFIKKLESLTGDRVLK
jgi:hypothetical protein